MALRRTLDNVALFVSFLSLHGLPVCFGQIQSSLGQDKVPDDFLTSQQQLHHTNAKRIRERSPDLTDISMRALVDITKNDDATYGYSDYYDTIDLDPSYYDILDYVYVDYNGTTGGTEPPLLAPHGNQNDVDPFDDIGSTSTTITATSVLPDGDSGSDRPNDTMPACDPKTHFGCNLAKFERCGAKPIACRCLNGYVRDQKEFDHSPCVAADFFRGHLKTRFHDREEKGEISSQVIRPIESNLTDYLQLLLDNQGIPGLLYLKVHVPKVTALSKRGVVSLTFDVALRRSSSDKRHEIRDIWHKGLGTETLKLPNALHDILQSIGWNNSRGGDVKDIFSPLVETNPCHHPEHNYCGPNSQCQRVEDIPTCTCEAGYQDVSPDVIQAPGEMCVEDCRCENNGVCVKDLTGDKRQCSCLNWYFGSKCQINGKELLIICCCSLGCLLFMAAIFWCCYYGCVKHKLRATKTNLFSFAPNTNFLKLPRVWMDSRYENDVSPRSLRRMSFASDGNPYLDGFILEDLPPSGHQTQSRRGDVYGPHYQPGNQGVSTLSSHSFFCPY